jgi:hypothetical protein
MPGTHTTLTEMADRAQVALNDTAAGTWPQATVEEWCLDALREYNQHFFKSAQDFIDCVADQHNYDLNADFRGVIYVSYPWDITDPVYLKRMSRQHPSFWLSDDYCDIHESYNPNTAAQIWISASPAAGEQIYVHYAATYDTDLTGIDNFEIPPEHDPIILAFVIWRAHQERLATEAQNPDTTIRMLQQMKLAVQSTEFTYRQLLRRAEAARADGGPTGPWEVDGYDRIY